MSYQQVSKIKSNKDIVHFSNKATFYYQGILFKVFKTDLKNPKAPQLAILNVDTGERVSGLFHIGSNTYQGDTKSDTGKKVYFRLKFIDQTTIELTDFESALIQIGSVIPEVEINPCIEPQSPLQPLSKSGVEVVSEREKSDILNHNQIAHFNSGF